MTRSLTLCVFFLSALVLGACSDVPIGKDDTKLGDGGQDAAADGRAPELAPEVARDAAPDLATCMGQNPAAQTCRKSANDCIPSSCTCGPAGTWQCTADCPINVPLCTDGGMPDLPTDVPADVPVDLGSDGATDALTCSGGNPAARTCRTSANDCIPSSCSCAADGNWRCTADCPNTLPLCADGGVPTTDGGPCPAGQVLRYESPGCGVEAKPVCGSPNQDACFRGVCSCKGQTISRCDYASEPFASFGACSDAGDAPDLPSDRPSDPDFPPADEQSCLKAANVPTCDIWTPYGTVNSAVGGAPLAKVEVTRGLCTGGSCSSGCTSISVVGQTGIGVGATCDSRVTSTDGRSQLVTLSVEANPSPSHMCCGSPADGHGIWTALNDLVFSPSPVVVEFSGDGGATTRDLGGEALANPCAKCAANEVCTQRFDGTCHLGTVACKAVSESCRTKLGASGVKNCRSIPECESEFCTSPFQCVYNSPCGTEAPEAQLYCYGP